MLTKEQIAKIAVSALEDKMAKELQILRIETITTLADYFIICTGSSNTHVRTLMEEVEQRLGLSGIKPHHIEGHGSNTWVLMDYTSVIIHIFTDEARKFYQLDRVWADAIFVEPGEIATDPETGSL
ncbi:MAG: ribosome silencing factor [Clostridiales bacterium]|jgi:ribosome-associated protein|nr:ribosome silencing factor [Clostridiales bacterium]